MSDANTIETKMKITCTRKQKDKLMQCLDDCGGFCAIFGDHIVPQSVCDENGENSTCKVSCSDICAEQYIEWDIISTTPTYIEDFMSKFPKANRTKIIDESCINVIYGANCHRCDGLINCDVCWNQHMPEEQ